MTLHSFSLIVHITSIFLFVLESQTLHHFDSNAQLHVIKNKEHILQITYSLP